MNARPPSLRKHATGQFMVRWAGQDRYLGHDRSKAQAEYLKQLEEWARWRAERDAKITLPLRTRVYTVVEIAEAFMSQKEVEGGRDRRRYYQNHLRRFVGIYRNVRADLVRPADLNALKLDMIRAGFGPRNIQHDLVAVRSMFSWASGIEMIPAVNLRLISAPPAPPVPDKSYSSSLVWSMFMALPEHVGNWVALQYLALMRPSEVVRLVHRQGEFEQPWLFRMDSKVAWRTREHRRVVLSDGALFFLARCEPRWSRYDTYYHAVAESAAAKGLPPFSPHPLRHSGATHLAMAGVDRQDIDLLLGHLPARVSRIYNRIDWKALREPVSRIALQICV